MNNQPPKVNPRFPLLRMLIATMEEVVKADLAFDIRVYFDDEDQADEATDIHNCGTPACVAGYGAVTPEIQNYVYIDTVEFDSFAAADQVLWALERELGSVSHAITSGTSKIRNLYASENLPELSLGFSHVNKNNPTSADALAFMKYVLECCLDATAKGVPRKSPEIVLRRT